jgi:hypothetical protein
MDLVETYAAVAGIHLQSPRHFAWQPSVRVSQTLRSSYLSHMIATAMYEDEYWHLHRSDFRNTLIYANTTSRTVPACDINLGWLTLPTPKAGNFVELILL